MSADTRQDIKITIRATIESPHGVPAVMIAEVASDAFRAILRAEAHDPLGSADAMPINLAVNSIEMDVTIDGDSLDDVIRNDEVLAAETLRTDTRYSAIYLAIQKVYPNMTSESYETAAMDALKSIIEDEALDAEMAQ